MRYSFFAHATLGFIALITFIFPSQSHAQCNDGNCQDGRGTFQYDNGNVYRGDFVKGIPQGKGTLQLSSGASYTGDWAAGVRQGIGIFTMSNGNVYTGAFRRNRFEGIGTMTYRNGDKYAGNWLNDQPNGDGKYFFKSGDRYEGAFKNGKFEGIGTMTYANGSKYSGEWLANQRHGRGTLSKANGQSQAGEWQNGNLKDAPNDAANTNVQKPTEEKIKNCNTEYCNNCKGEYRYGDGTRFVGDFKEGQGEGLGTCYYVNGDKYVGRWEKHAPNGEGIMYFKNGRVVGAIWDYGKAVGELPSNDKNINVPVEVDYNPAVKIWAVVVGVGRYQTMPTLKYSDDDAYQYYAFLKSPEGGALPDAQVKVLVDEDATRANILQTMRQTLLRADDNDVVIFYFSGHGLEGSFLPVDYDGFNNKLLHNDVKNILLESKAKHKICLADACHSGTLLAMKTSLTMQETIARYYSAFNDTKGGLALLMSSKAEEYSLEDQGLRSGIFSHYLIRGLKGEADMNKNNIVTIRELFDYIYKNVRSYTSSAQTPMISGKYDEAMPVSVVRN